MIYILIKLHIFVRMGTQLCREVHISVEVGYNYVEGTQLCSGRHNYVVGDTIL